MIRAGVGQSSNASTASAATEALQKALAQAGAAKADAALVFFSVEHAARERELAETVRRVAGTDQVAGCSAYALHANCYVIKPADLDELFQAIAWIERFWLNTAVLPSGAVAR